MAGGPRRRRVAEQSPVKARDILALVSELFESVYISYYYSGAIIITVVLSLRTL